MISPVVQPDFVFYIQNMLNKSSSSKLSLTVSPIVSVHSTTLLHDMHAVHIDGAVMTALHYVMGSPVTTPPEVQQ